MISEGHFRRLGQLTRPGAIVDALFPTRSANGKSHFPKNYILALIAICCRNIVFLSLVKSSNQHLRPTDSQLQYIF